ncbi:3591_t:CDS:2 [Dentiscutata erythropus]|uniref:3591_t:CDS:1 n=1 Tax=Dentiscutata erythropus TaxID=1348616 RepID=A0A9N9BDZ0_9GLOM|nr:3591_t:CDS:2 [Dentiscutata erythropus]
MEPTNETNLPFQYYPFYLLFKESLIDKTILYGSEDNNIGYTPFDFKDRHPSFREDEHPSSTNVLTDKAYPLGLKNTNTDAQPFFDSENANVIDSHEESVNIDHNDIDDNTEDELDELKLFKDKLFDTWEIAESYLDQYGKQEGFSLHKHCRVADSKDNSITHRHTYEYSHGHIHEADKTVLAENRRDRELEIIDCPWHINLSFSKIGNSVQINSIIGKYNHLMNPLIAETAPKFCYLTDEMYEKIKFWAVEGRLGATTQYNLLAASFPEKKINKKNLSNTIQHYKK